jgi:hypothetical protein
MQGYSIDAYTSNPKFDAPGHLSVHRGTTGNFWGSDVFLHILFLDDHNFINNHLTDLKLVSNDALCDLPQSALKIRL